MSAVDLATGSFQVCGIGDDDEAAAEFIVCGEAQQGAVEFGELRLHLGAPFEKGGHAELEVGVHRDEFATRSRTDQPTNGTNV